MAKIRIWKAFFVQGESQPQFMGLTLWQDQLIRWCRQFLRSLRGNKSATQGQVVFYSYDDRPSGPARRSRGFRPFSGDSSPEAGWEEGKVFQHPYEELLKSRDRARSNWTMMVDGRQ